MYRSELFVHLTHLQIDVSDETVYIRTDERDRQNMIMCMGGNVMKDRESLENINSSIVSSTLSNIVNEPERKLFAKSCSPSSEPPPLSQPPPLPPPLPPDFLQERGRVKKRLFPTSPPTVRKRCVGPSPCRAESYQNSDHELHGPEPPPIVVHSNGQVVANVREPPLQPNLAVENTNPTAGKRIFVRTKLYRRPILSFGLVDTGNLSRCLVSEDLWNKVKAPLHQTNQRLRSADGSEMKVLGAARNFKIYLENVRKPVILEDPLVVSGLTVPLNISMSQLEKARACIDCSEFPKNVLRFPRQGTSSPLYSLSTPYLSPSQDSRFHEVIENLLSQQVKTEVQLESRKINWAQADSKVSHAYAVTPPGLEKLVPARLPSAPWSRGRPPERTNMADLNVKRPRSVQAGRASRVGTTHMCAAISAAPGATSQQRLHSGKPGRGIPRIRHNDVTHTLSPPPPTQHRTHVLRAERNRGDRQEKDSVKTACKPMKICDFGAEAFPVYLKYATPLPKNSMVWVETRIHNMIPHQKGTILPALFTGAGNRNFMLQHLVKPVTGVYSFDLNRSEMRVLVSNRGDEEILLPCSIKLGTLQKAEELKDYCPPDAPEETGVVQQVDHRPVGQLTAAEKAERYAFLKENVDLKDSLFNTRQREKLLQILFDNFDAVSVNSDDFGHTTTEEFKLKLVPGATPFIDRCRPLNPRHLADLDRQLKEWGDAGVIEPSHSPWASALVPVRKKGTDKLRWAVDYRRLNEVVQTDAYPLPSIESNLQLLHGSRIYTTLDSAGAFHGIPVAPETRPLTAFISPRGLWQFCRMPFGIKSSPSVYARMVAKALNTLPGEAGRYALGYLDDIICHSRSPEQHLKHLEFVMAMHKVHGMKIKLSKCRFGQAKAEYLGHVVSQEGISMNPDYTKRIRDWPLPATVPELRSFLGTVGYYRSFICDYGNLTAEMEGMKSQKSKLIWKDEVIKKFEKLKELFQTGPIRAYPDFSDQSGKFILETDFSTHARSAVLLQEDPKGGPAKFLGCCAAKNSPAAANYSSNKGELAAVILGLRKFEHLLTWKKFAIVTDNACVSFLRNIKNNRGIYARWREIIASFDFEISHRPGKSNFFAESLSRRTDLDHSDEIADEREEEILDVYSLVDELDLPRDAQVEGLGEIPLAELQAETAADPVLAKILPFVKRGSPPDQAERKKLSLEELPYINRFPTLFLRHQVLLTYSPSGFGEDYTPKICIPDALKAKVFRTSHGVNAAGHHGITRTLDCLQDRVYFPRMRTYVEEKVNGCEQCFQKTKKTPAKRHVQHREHVGRPGARIYMDLVGPLNVVPYHGKEASYILTILDGFTRFLIAVPLYAITGYAVVCGLLNNYVYQFGIPETIHTDNGVQFTSNNFKATLKMYNINHTVTPAYTPEGNRVERHHRTLASLLRCENPAEGTWVEKLPATIFAINTATNRITGLSPFEATFGRPARVPLDVILPPEINIETDQPLLEHLRDLKQHLAKAYEYMRKTEGASIQREVARDMQKTPVVYRLGDRVSVFSPRPTPGLARKLQRHWRGPFIVVKVISPSLIRIRPEGTWSKDHKSIDVTPDRLKKWTCLPTKTQLHEPQPELDAMEDFSDEIDLVPPAQEGPLGLGPSGLPPEPVRVLPTHPGPSPGPSRLFSGATVEPPPPQTPALAETTVQPTTAFPDVTLPDPDCHPPFQPVEDEILPPSAPPPLPITPGSAEFPPPRESSPVLPPPGPPRAQKELRFETSPPIGVSPFPPSPPPRDAPDLLEEDLPALPLPALPAAAETLEKAPAPTPPPLPPLYLRRSGRVPKPRLLPPLPARIKAKLPPPPRPRRVSSPEIENVPREGDVPHLSPSGSVKRPRSEDLEIVLRTTRQRIGSVTGREIEEEAPPKKGRGKPP